SGAGPYVSATAGSLRGSAGRLPVAGRFAICMPNSCPAEGHDQMNESVHLGRVSGIRLGANWSLFPILFLIAWTLAATLLPAAAPGYSAWGYWLFALLTAATFYACLLAHELAHALVARRHGVEVRGIV